MVENIVVRHLQDLVRGLNTGSPPHVLFNQDNNMFEEVACLGYGRIG